MSPFTYQGLEDLATYYERKTNEWKAYVEYLLSETFDISYEEYITELMYANRQFLTWFAAYKTVCKIAL